MFSPYLTKKSPYCVDVTWFNCCCMVFCGPVNHPKNGGVEKIPGRFGAHILQTGEISSPCAGHRNGSNKKVGGLYHNSPLKARLDRAYEGDDETRTLASSLGFSPVVPPKSNRKTPLAIR
jgi:hypothetical protein